MVNSLYQKRGGHCFFIFKSGVIPENTRFLIKNGVSDLTLPVNYSILVICQELLEIDFDMFFRKKGNFNRPSVYFTYNRMSVRLNIIFGVQLFAGVQLVFDQQSKNESY